MASKENDSLQATLINTYVREYLNKKSVKLWLHPYTNVTEGCGANEQEIRSLSESCSVELNLSVDDVLPILLELRSHAIEKLEARKKLKDNNILSCKVKLSGSLPSTVTTKLFNIEISCDGTGSDIKQAISQCCGIDIQNMKVICAGRVIDSSVQLSEHKGIKNLCQLLVLYLPVSEVEAHCSQEMGVSKVQQTVSAAEKLFNTADDDISDEHYLHIADQTGKPLDIPPSEKKALLLAMTLHEKGKAALTRFEYGDALLLLTEADEQFVKCSSSLLDCVDNYGLLCLDIVWCYLCLQNLDHIQDAERRLQKCEACFHKSYGPNLERLATLKGGTGQERALFMRLHLLQGILAVHKCDKTVAKSLLNKAQHEWQSLQINDDSLIQMQGLGFSVREARLGLRAAAGDLQSAVQYAVNKQKEKKNMEEEDDQERSKRRRYRKLGKTANGQKVSLKVYDQLKSMGFNKQAAAEALRQANNNMSDALEMLQNNPELLTLPDTDPEETKFQVTDDLLAQVTAAGFDMDSARYALNFYKGDIQKVLTELLERNGIPDDAWLKEFVRRNSKNHRKRSKADKESYDDLVSDLSRDGEEYLDLTLDQEAEFLKKYLDMVDRVL